MASDLLYWDDLDTRKFLFKGLSHRAMTDRIRLAFVKKCAKQAADKMLEFKVVPNQDFSYTPYQAFMDLSAICLQQSYSFEKVLVDLNDLLKWLT